MQPESGLFQVQFNEQGKKYLKKFASISYTIIGLVVFESGIAIYWHIKILLTRSASTGETVYFTDTVYNRLFPYFAILLNLMIIFSNLLYTRFPRALLRNVEQGDEYGANHSFQLLTKSAWIYLAGLIIGTAEMIWNLLSR